MSYPVPFAVMYPLLVSYPVHFAGTYPLLVSYRVPFAVMYALQGHIKCLIKKQLCNRGAVSLKSIVSIALFDR